MYFSEEIREIQDLYTSYYLRLEEYEKCTKKNLPNLIAQSEDLEEIKSLIEELMINMCKGIPDDRQYAAHQLAHFFMEQILLLSRLSMDTMMDLGDMTDVSAKDYLKANLIVEDIIQTIQDYEVLSGYLLDIAYGLLE